MEKIYAKVEGYTHLVRDLETNAIINMNNQEYNSYISVRNIKNNDNTKINNIETDLNQVKSDLNEIKSLLKNLINGS